MNEPVKYRIIADLEQLKSIGCDETELNQEGTIVKEYTDGWVQLSVKHPVLGESNQDFPMYMLKRI